MSQIGSVSPTGLPTGTDITGARIGPNGGVMVGGVETQVQQGGVWGYIDAGKFTPYTGYANNTDPSLGPVTSSSGLQDALTGQLPGDQQTGILFESENAQGQINVQNRTALYGNTGGFSFSSQTGGGTPDTGQGRGGDGGGGTGTGGTFTPQGGTQAQQDAMSVIQTMLDSYGLGSLASWAWTELTSGKSVDQITFDLRQTPTYQQSIFGQTNKARQAGGLPVMTEAEILAYKTQASQMYSEAGLPKNFYSTDAQLAAFMGQDISMSELTKRVQDGYEQAAQAPPEIRQALTDLYGVDQGHLAAFFLDPTAALPLIQQRFRAAQISGVAAITGYGELTQTPAEQLAQMGVTQQQAQSGFTQLGGEQQLFGALPGTQEAEIGQQVQLGAEFMGNAADQLTIEQRAAQRKAAFQGGGQYAQTTKGIAGVGVAQPA